MKFIDWIKNNSALSIILIASALLRFFNLDFQSLWVDEIYTLNESNPNFSLSELYNSIMTSDPHPPLYFVLVYIFFKIFGYSAFVLKAFSAILSILGVYTTYLLGKELHSKKAGIYASFLISINFFSIYYSQEGRMYSLLFLTTTLAFYYLIKFIKLPTNRSAILFGVFSALMIYSHLFAIFTLFSQYLILLYFIIRPFEINRKKMFLYIFSAGIATIILYIPVIGIILKNTKRDSIWIQMPVSDVYIQFFKDFFGQSELVIFFIVLLLLSYFINLISKKGNYDFKINPNIDKNIFSFLILFIWITITLILPLIITYSNLPMLINRYFINILPAIIIILAIGATSIKSKTVRYGILSFITIFSLADIFVVKKFYFTPYKTQFREVSQFILDNNTENEPVATSLAPYFPYYLNNDKVKTTILDLPLQTLVNEMIVGTRKKHSFWYVDGHSKPLNLDETATKFLDDNFTIENSIDFYDAWTKHYVFGKENIITSEDLSKFDLRKNSSGDKIKYWIENFEIKADTISVSGWAYLEDHDANRSQAKVVLISKTGKSFKVQTQHISRSDITKSNNSKYNLDNSGISTKIPIDKIPSGNYTFGIMVKNNDTKKEGLIISDKKYIKA